MSSTAWSRALWEEFWISVHCFCFVSWPMAVEVSFRERMGGKFQLMIYSTNSTSCFQRTCHWWDLNIFIQVCPLALLTKCEKETITTWWAFYILMIGLAERTGFVHIPHIENSLCQRILHQCFSLSIYRYYFCKLAKQLIRDWELHLPKFKTQHRLSCQIQGVTSI